VVSEKNVTFTLLMVFHPVLCVTRVRVRVLGLGFCVRVRVSVTGSVSYLNAKFVVFLPFVAPSGECR